MVFSIVIDLYMQHLLLSNLGVVAFINHFAIPAHHPVDRNPLGDIRSEDVQGVGVSCSRSWKLRQALCLCTVWGSHTAREAASSASKATSDQRDNHDSTISCRSESSNKSLV